MLIVMNNDGFKWLVNIDRVTTISESAIKEFALCFCFTSEDHVKSDRYRSSDRCNEIIGEIVAAYENGKAVYELPQA